MMQVKSLVNTKFLHHALKTKTDVTLRILDATFHLPNANRNAEEEFLQKHIPGAQFFSITDCCDKTSKYEHMLPKPQQFADYVGSLGIRNDSKIIVYDTSDNYGFFSAQRLWWMFRVFGHEQVSVLNGGFKKWCADGYPTESSVQTVQKETFTATYNANLVKSFEDLVDNLTKKNFQVIDARSPGRFNGTSAEPRNDIKPGHIPDAKNIHYILLVDENTGELKSEEELQKVFISAGVNLEQPIVASCGSGVSACSLAFAAHTLGLSVPVYDGAWVEWYQRSSPDQRA